MSFFSILYENNPKASTEDLVNSKKVITINGYDYTAQEFMDRVLEYTIASNPINSMQTEIGSTVKFSYNKKRQRIKKTTAEGTTTYEYDNFNNLISELLPNGKCVIYSYTLKDGCVVPESLFYQNDTYYYSFDNNGTITGLVDKNHQMICEYTYEKNGKIKHIYEIKDGEKIKHTDKFDDNFIGCVNSLRYDGKYYDSETNMYYINAGGYYDTRTNDIVGDTCQVNMKGLFGDKFDTLSEMKNFSQISSSSISPSEQQALLSAAAYIYSNSLNSFGTSYINSGSSWYTSFSNSTMHYLLATRIIYAENTYCNSGDSTMDIYLEYNREGIAWEITNRLLEDKYRYSNGYNQYFSVNTTPATSPSFYTVLTKPSAFTSINSNDAKGAISSSNRAFQEALWLACCMNVCNNFDQWNAVVPRPIGITSQCYNRGALSSSSSPGSNWNKVVFPGWSNDYTGMSSYSGFVYFSNISKFNIVFGQNESLFINSIYYN